MTPAFELPEANMMGGGALFFGKEGNVGGGEREAAGSLDVGSVRGKGEG